MSQLSSLSGTDSWQWLIGNDSTFTVSETRKHIDDIILPSLQVSTRWCKALPRKVNIFMWRLRLDRLPHRLNLSRRGIDINSILCSVCNKGMESNEHLFCSCEVAFNVWSLIRSWCDAQLPVFNSVLEGIEWIDAMRKSNVLKERMFVIAATTWWMLWKFRNNITFNTHSMRKK